MLFEGGFTFTNFLVDILAIFVFVLWFWLLLTVMGDLFRRDDIPGWRKVIWIILLLVLPYLGIFFYLLLQSRHMADRVQARDREARERLRQVVGFSVADELAKLEKLRSSGSLSQDEFKRLRAKLL